ncbi:hypothetical protein ISG33_07845 [Glaciecola sp. MH2013]|uniref:hypothetical protein n=1 Tax=Glaciecola sp. MH2013 TaxID=2785524 RepID=UPI0018A085D8|nr:hypothetical protein [Glaciecola sp. MH2013]MBF7073306.1 hypothetical protein [Glaciecola sp. MH2013]
MKNSEEKVPFFDNPENVKWILRVFYALCVLLVIADFIVHRHIYVSFEEIPAFYAIYGFIACVVLVVIAKEMRKLVMRSENYYDDRHDESESPEVIDSEQRSSTTTAKDEQQ